MAADESEGLTPGTVFGRYSIVRKIGAGGMGAVYEARHVELNKQVALKTLHRDVAANGEARARFLREGQTATKIRHPDVVDISDVGIHEGTPFLVMEYLEGTDLAALIDPEQLLSIEQIAEIMLPVCSAVAAAHEENIVHRDLKPENIFLAHSKHGGMQPKLLDFGISKQAGAAPNLALTGTGALLGTPYYMAPEQAGGAKHADARSDQYSLGVILYECATARRPFPGDTLYRVLHGIVEGVFERPRTHRADLPERFEQLILRAMAKNPEARFENVHALGHALLAFASPQVRAVWERVFDRPLAVATTALSQPGFVSRASTPGSAAPSHPSELPTASTISRSVFELAARPDRTTGSGVPRRALVAGGLLFVLATVAAGIGLGTQSGRVAPNPPPTRAAADPTVFRATLRVSPAIATVELDGELVGRGHLQREFPRDGVEHTLRFTAEGYETRTLTFRDAAPVAFLELARATAIAPPVAAASSNDTPAPVPLETSPTRPSRGGRTHGSSPHRVAPVEPAAPRANNAPIIH